MLHGDFGNSVITSHPVLEDLLQVFPATIELSLPALIIGVVLGVPLGVLAATHRGRWQDQVIRMRRLFGYSMPVFWLGLVGLLLFYAKLGWVDGPGRLDVGYDDIVPTGHRPDHCRQPARRRMRRVLERALGHLVLPASILGYLSLAYIARMTRSFMLDQLRQEYVLATLAKGLSPWRVVWRHALGNIWVPLITVIALTFGSLLEGAVLTETVFAWPGLGLYMKNSLFNADMNAVLGGTMVVGVVYIGLNMLSDLLYPLVDPRARDQRWRPHPLRHLGARLAAEPGARQPHARRAAAAGTAPGCGFRRNPLAMTGLGIVLLLVLMAVFAPLIADRQAATLQELADRLQPASGALVRHRRARPRHLRPHRLRRAHHAHHRRPRRRHRGAGRPRHRPARRLFRRRRRHGADAHHRHLPGVPAPGAGAGLRRRAGPGHRERRHRHRADRLAALCPPRPRRDADPPAGGVHRGRASCRAPRTLRIIATQIVPLCLPRVIIRLTLDMAGIILTAAGLGFLGLGAQPPTPEWGAMVSSGRQVLLDQWWVATIPGIAIFIVSLGFNLLGDGLRDVGRRRRS